MSTKRTWRLNSYANNVWTTLVKAPVKLRALIIANTAAINATVSASISDGEGGTNRSVILPDTAFQPGQSEVLDLIELNLGRNDVLQLRFSVAGVNVTGSGEEA